MFCAPSGRFRRREEIRTAARPNQSWLSHRGAARHRPRDRSWHESSRRGEDDDPHDVAVGETELDAGGRAEDELVRADRVAQEGVALDELLPERRRHRYRQ